MTAVLAPLLPLRGDEVRVLRHPRSARILCDSPLSPRFLPVARPAATYDATVLGILHLPIAPFTIGVSP